MLDSEAFSALAGKRSKRQEEVRAALAAAAQLRRDVIVPAVVLAELYRGHGRSSLLDACLSRETGLSIRNTDRSFARLVGGVLAAARAGSELLADAHVVAAAVEAGGGVVLTGDPDDIVRLASRHRNIQVIDIT